MLVSTTIRRFVANLVKVNGFIEIMLLNDGGIVIKSLFICQRIFL